MPVDITPYLDLIPSQHRSKSRFIATMTLLLNAIAGTIETTLSIPTAFDLDTAVGVQLDVLGKWIGQSRNLLEPIAGVYFGFDHPSLGFDQGTWKGPFDPDEGLTALDDDTLRLVLRAKIGANHWDGSIPQAYAILDPIFATANARIIIVDGGDMSMSVGILGGPLTPVAKSLLLHGFFDLKPVGVRIAEYITPSVMGAAFFGFDVENDAIAGFDTGAWPMPLA